MQRYLNKHYFWLCLWQSCWVRWPPESGNWEKPMTPLSVVGNLLIHWWLEYNKNVEKKNLLTSLSLSVCLCLCWFLSLSLCVFLSLCLPDWAGTSIFCLQTGVYIISASGSGSGLDQKLQHQFSWFSGLWTCTWTVLPVFPGLKLIDKQIIGTYQPL